METEVQKRLWDLQDLDYRDFHSKLMPTVDKEKIIGVRTPILRSFAKEFAKTSESRNFLKDLPHKYYEEDNLHGFIIESIKEFDESVKEVDIFLSYVDNWATCDMMSPKVFKKHLPELMEYIKVWIASHETYRVRFAVDMLMKFYLDDDVYEKSYLDMVANIKSDEYYVKMVVAWYFATALAKQYDDAVKIIEDKVLDTWTHNKTIQKAVESYRISTEQKEYLKQYKIKE